MQHVLAQSAARNYRSRSPTSDYFGKCNIELPSRRREDTEADAKKSCTSVNKQPVGNRKQASTTKNYIRVQEKIQKSRLTARPSRDSLYANIIQLQKLAYLYSERWRHRGSMKPWQPPEWEGALLERAIEQ